jgi:hypothetical protein
MTLTMPVGTTRAQNQATRIWSVVRLHLVNKMIYVGIPWIIVATAWVFTMIIALLITFAAGVSSDRALAGMTYSWAVISPLWYLVVVAVQSINLTFQFALGLSVTRRDFYLGTSLLFVLISIFNAVGLSTLTEIERATNGWGIGAHMFTSLWFGQFSWFPNFLIYAIFQLGIFFIGACIATVYLRWRITGMLIFWLSFALLLIGLTALITLTNNWAPVGGWLAAQGVLGLFFWLLVPTAIAAVFGYFVLRKATPKN